MCHSVFDMCLFDILNLNVILDCFHKNGRVLLFYSLDTVRNVIIQGIIHSSRVNHNHIICSELFDSLINIIVCMYTNMIFLKFRLDFIIQLTLVHIKLNRIHFYNRIRKKQREVFNIISPYIQKPARIIQTCNDMCISPCLLHCSPYAFQLGSNSLACILYIQKECRFLRKRRSVFPDLIHEIIIIDHTAPLFCRNISINLSFIHSNSASVKTNHTVFT